MVRAGNAVVVVVALWAAACTGTVTLEPDDAPAGQGAADSGSPPPPPGSADASPQPTGLTAEEDALFAEINAQREMRGLTRVTLRDDLNCAAKRHSTDVGAAGSCSHTGTDGSDPGSRVSGCGGPGWSGEILACGQGTPVSAVEAWINSPGHNEIMFTPSQVYVGVAMHNNYWTAIFDR